MQKLLCVLEPKSDENIFSYIGRLAIENNYDHNDWIYKFCNIKSYFGVRNISPQNFDMSPIKHLTLIEEEVLWKTTLYNDLGFEKEKKFEFIDNTISHYALLGINEKICPICFKEGLFINKLWDIRMYLVCPIHNCKLVLTCSSCNKKIKPYRRSLIKCSCGQDLREVPIEFVNSSDFIFEKIIYNKFYNTDLFFSFEKNNFLSNLKIKNIILLFIFFLRLFLRDNGRSGNSQIPFDPSNEKGIDLVKKVTSIFEDWPNNFHAFLDTFDKHVKNKTKFDRGSLFNTFGYFYKDLYNKYQDYPAFDALRSEFQNYLFKYWDKTNLSHCRTIDINIDKLTHISTTEAAKLLNTHHKQIRNYIKLGYLRSISTTDRNSYIMISRESLEEFKKEKEELLTSKEVMKILNIGNSTLKNLEDEGILSPQGGPRNDGRYHKKQSVIQLLTTLEQQFKNDKLIDSSNKSFIKITNGSKKVIGTKISDIILLIMKGKLLIRNIDKKSKGLKRFEADQKELIVALYNYKIDNKKSVLSLNELTLFLNVEKSLIRKVIREGIIKKTNLMDKFFIDVKDAIEFKKNYIAFSEMVLEHDYEKCLKILQELNIVPVVKFYDRCTKRLNHLYRRNDVLSKREYL